MALALAARLVTFAVICGVLYWGQVLLIPLALALFVTFLLSPLITALDRLHVPRIVGVLCVMLCVGGVIGGLGYVVVGELAAFAEELPQHRQNIRAKISDLRSLLRGGTLEKVQTTINDISKDVENAATSGAAEPSPAREQSARPSAEAAERAGQEPLQVEIVPERELLGDTQAWSPAFEAAATGGLTLLLSIFMLLRREDLRNRFVSLAGETSVVITTKAFADAGQRISRYLLMQFVINASMGLAVGIGLYFIGVPYAALWGLTAAVFRYIPYVGPWLAALLPIGVSLVTAPGWEQVLLVIGLFAVLELFSNNVMEPWLYGQSVGLSALAVIVSAIFWTWIWGPVGLVLATPLTVCLVVLSRHIPELGVFDRLLSDQPAQQAHLWLYQRLLARDEEEAQDIIERHLAEHGLEATCEELLLGSLIAVRRDLAAGRITDDEGDFVATALSDIIDDLPPAATDAGAEPDAEGSRAAASQAAARPTEPALLVGLPVRDKIDETALELLRMLLRDRPIELDIQPAEKLLGERIAEAEERSPAAVCIVSLPPGDLTRLRHACKRVRAKLPDVPLLVARLNTRSPTARTAERLGAAGADTVVGALAELRETLDRKLRRA